MTTNSFFAAFVPKLSDLPKVNSSEAIFTTFALYLWLFGKGAKPAQAGFDRLALTSYLVTALGIVAASLVTGAGGLALIGFFAMLPWVLAGWLKIA